MKAIIDQTVLNAQAYYAKYLREPSPAGDITFSAKEIAVIADLDLKVLLGEMKKLGKGGEMMVATHSDPKGFKMPIVKGGKTSVLFSVMPIMLKISEGISRRDAIKSLPAAQHPQAWKNWFKDFEPGVHLDKGFETVDGWEKFVEKKFDEWQVRQGTQILKLPNPQQDLPDIIGLLNDVRQLKFKRLEFRACRIGTKPDEIKTVAQFFGAQTVVGPKEVRTFYGVIAKIEIVADAAKFARLQKRLGGRRFAGISIAMQILKHSFRVIATDEAQAKTFVQKFISSAFTGGVKPFVIGGLEPAGKAVIAGKAHIFPLESDYNNLLVMFPATSGTP